MMPTFIFSHRKVPFYLYAPWFLAVILPPPPNPRAHLEELLGFKLEPKKKKKPKKARKHLQMEIISILK